MSVESGFAAKEIGHRHPLVRPQSQKNGETRRRRTVIGAIDGEWIDSGSVKLAQELVPTHHWGRIIQAGKPRVTYGPVKIASQNQLPVVQSLHVCENVRSLHRTLCVEG